MTSPFKCESDGYIYTRINANSGIASITLRINGNSILGAVTANWAHDTNMIPVKKGDTVTYSCGGDIQSRSIVFYPCR